jgi:hypothetical protein
VTEATAEDGQRSAKFTAVDRTDRLAAKNETVNVLAAAINDDGGPGSVPG